MHLEGAICQRNDLIEELTISLQRSVKERDILRSENDHLINEVQQLQHSIAEKSEHGTVKGQLSDLIKYESMMKDESTRFYSAIMSTGSSAQSTSSGEQKDNDAEEILVNYSRSDLKSSDGSDDFQTGFENKLADLIEEFNDSIEDNLRNKLTEKLQQFFVEEIGKIRLDLDTEMKDVENQMRQNKQTFTIETSRLRELLATVKSGNADIEALRQELSIKHEKEMENCRTYFEKKCSDLERR